jgi:hypothetical protein
MRSKFLVPAVLLLSLSLSPGLGRAAAEPAPAPSKDVLLTLTSEAGKTIPLTAADLEKLPHQKVQAADRGQDAAEYEGVPLNELLKLAGATLGDALGHGDAPIWYVTVEAKDNYRALFSLSELDPAFTDRVVLLVDRKSGKPLAADEGPLRIVIPGEKRHARWVRQVTGLRIGRI